jgi:hypothetical protein
MITVDVSGSVTRSGGAYAVGTAFSGSFTYDPTTAPSGGGTNFNYFPALTAFTFDIGGDMLRLQSPGSGDIQVVNGSFGTFNVQGNTMQGTGPLAGHSVALEFDGSSDPSIANIELPSSLPTDFTSTHVLYFIGSLVDLGPHL